MPILGIPARVDCNVAFDRAIQNLSRAIHESGARITREPLPACPVEEFPLGLLFQNLIGNAIKSRRAEEPPRIDVRAHKQDGMWHFFMTDNGIGIEPHHLDTIFVPFKRLHGSDAYPGSGLGRRPQRSVAKCYGVLQRLLMIGLASSGAIVPSNSSL